MKMIILKPVTPMKYPGLCVAKANKQLISKCGNLQCIKSESVARKVRSEALGRLKRDNDDEVDLLLARKDHPNYIQQVLSPLNIKIFSKEQLFIYDHSIDHVMCFNATGTVVRSEGGTGKILYYCGVVIVKQLHKLCSIFEMVSAEHDTDAVYNLFSRFLKFCSEHKKGKL